MSVSEDAVKAASKAVVAALNKENFGMASCFADATIENITRAALTAAAPHMVAGERDACARIADGTSGDPEWPGESWIAQRIATAIRNRAALAAKGEG